MKITRGIPCTIQRVKTEQQQHNAARDGANSRSLIAYGTMEASLAATGAIIPAIVAGATMLPLAAIILPVALPLVAFFSWFVGSRQAEEASSAYHNPFLLLLFLTAVH
jgi:hypothetical protein